LIYMLLLHGIEKQTHVFSFNEGMGAFRVELRIMQSIRTILQKG